MAYDLELVEKEARAWRGKAERWMPKIEEIKAEHFVVKIQFEGG